MSKAAESEVEYVYLVRWCTDIIVGAAKTLKGAKQVAQDHDSDTSPPQFRETLEWESLEVTRTSLLEDETVSRQKAAGGGVSLYAIDRMRLHP